MPVEFGIWRIDESVIPVPSSPIDNEARLEGILEEDLTILGLDLLFDRASGHYRPRQADRPLGDELRFQNDIPISRD